MQRLWVVVPVGVVVVTAFTLFMPSGPKPRTFTGRETVKVVGQVIHQGEQPWKPGLSVREVVQAAGGLAPFARDRSVRVVDDATAHAVLHRLRHWLRDAVRPLEDGLAEAWEFCRLPGDSPEFGWLAPGPLAKATVNLLDPSSEVALEPGDVVFVDEKTVNF